MKTVDHALVIRRWMLGVFEIAETVEYPQLRKAWLTFAVTGAGPTGVELAGQIRELATHTISREYRSVHPSEAWVILYDGADAVPKPWGPALSAKARHTPRRIGVETELGMQVGRVDTHWLVTTDREGNETPYATRTVPWCAGLEAVLCVSAVAETTGAQTDRQGRTGRQGRISGTPCLTTPENPIIWVVGDVASLDRLPWVAEVAIRGGPDVASGIRRELVHLDQPSRPFRYRDLGSAAYICRGDAVVSLGTSRLSGVTGWLMWGAIHVAFLAAMRNRIRILTTWLVAPGVPPPVPIQRWPAPTRFLTALGDCARMPGARADER
jgi:NADH dehydrogenase